MEMSFTDIPISDIIYFLQHNHQPVSPINQENYNRAWNLIISNQNIEGPISIANWINNFNQIAYLDMLSDDAVGEILKNMDCTQIIKTCGLSKRLQGYCNQHLSGLLSEK